MFAAVTSYVTFIAVASAIATWVLFWGAMSAVVLARRNAVKARSILLGFVGPLGPLIALTYVLVVGIEGRS